MAVLVVVVGRGRRRQSAYLNTAVFCILAAFHMQAVLCVLSTQQHHCLGNRRAGPEKPLAEFKKKMFAIQFNYQNVCYSSYSNHVLPDTIINKYIKIALSIK